MAKTEQWKNRIVRSGEMPANQYLAHELNARRHPVAQREALRGSLDELGWVAPVIVSKRSGKVLDGHARVEEALSKDETALVPFVEVDVSEAEEKLVLAAYDPITLLAEYDKEALDGLLQSVNSDNAAIQAMLSELAAGQGLYFGDEPTQSDAEPQIDKAAELNKIWQVKKGDLFAIGQHRLLCGDSTKAEDVARLMGSEKAEILFTSPPYSDMRTYNGANVEINHLIDFISVWAAFADFLVVNIGLQFKDCEVVPYWDEYIQKAKNSGLKMLAWNVWDKTQSGSIAHATNMFSLTHEWLFVFGVERKRLKRTVPNQLDKYERRHGKNWKDGIDKSFRVQDDSMEQTTSKTYTHHQLHSVIQQTPELGHVRGLHPATFPVGLPMEYINAMVDDDGIVAECFAGSGTTLVAAQNLNRKCYAMEISENYCAVILQRMTDAFPAIRIAKIAEMTKQSYSERRK